MYNTLVKLMLIAALAQFGMSFANSLLHCQSGQCLTELHKHSLEVLDIDWKPISIFPEEAKRFR